jgi:hypothetical protein
VISGASVDRIVYAGPLAAQPSMPDQRFPMRDSGSADKGSRILDAVLYLALTLAWSWPLPIHLADRYTSDPGDPLLITYLLWWGAHARPFTSAWWNAPYYWPMRDALALTEHLAGLWPVAKPIQALGGSPLLATNIIVICATWWTLLATHALVKRLTGSTAAAVCGAVAFAFSPYRAGSLGHLQLYACWWIPLSLLAISVWAVEGRWRWLIVFAMSWILQALTSGYYVFILPPLYCAWAAWVIPWRTHARRALHLALVWAGSCLALAPVLLRYYHVQRGLGISRSRAEVAYYSGSLHSLLSAAPWLLFWHTSPATTSESALFPGVTVILLITAALVFRVRDRMLWFCAACAAAAFCLCLGPAFPGPSLASMWHPYDWLFWLPGFNGIRVPARFFMVAALCLAIAAAVAFAHLRTRVRRPALLTGIVFVGLFVDGAIAGMPLGVPPGRLPIIEHDVRLLTLPFDDHLASIRTMYQSMALGAQVVNGYAGYVPEEADVVAWALNRRDPTLLTELRRGRPLYVLVETSDATGSWTAFMDSQPDAARLGVSSGGLMYRMAPTPAQSIIVPGASLNPAAITRTPDGLTADLGAPHVVRFVELKTWGELVRLPASLVVQASLDGVSWRTVSDERPGGAALVGATEDPRSVPVRVVLPDVNARYIRVNAPAFHPQALALYAP